MDIALSFEMNVPQRHMFTHYPTRNEDLKEAGVRLIIDGNPTPLSQQIFVPSNSYAIVTYMPTYTVYTSDCFVYGNGPKLRFFTGDHYSPALCTYETLEERMYNICKCYFVAGDFYPRNDKVCTPAKTRECATKFLDCNKTEVIIIFKVWMSRVLL